MEDLAGIKGTYFDGIFFTEEPVDQCRLSPRPFKAEISRQNANLQQIKQRLAMQVRKAGGNALVGFRYGQRSHGILQQVLTFKWDTESWHGEGYPARIEAHQGKGTVGSENHGDPRR